MTGDALGEERRLVDALVPGTISEPRGLTDDRVLRSPRIREVAVSVRGSDGVDLFADREEEAHAVFAAL